MLNRFLPVEETWRLRGIALQVALFVAISFAAGAVLAAAIDLYSNVDWDSSTLQAWTLVPQTFVAAGLFLLGQQRGSRAFYVLGTLVVLVVIEETFHVLNPVEAWLDSLATWVAGWSGAAVGLVRLLLVYSLVALVAAAMFFYAHRSGSKEERPIVWTIAALLIAAGFFGGPISVLASEGHHPRWTFIEESGESLLFAATAGYVAGIAAIGGGFRSSRPIYPGESPL